MSKATWSVLVSLFFTIVTSVTPISERWRPFIVSAAWLALIFSCVGWLLTHISSEHKWRPTHSPLVLVAVGCIGAVLAIGVWLVVGPKDLQASSDSSASGSQEPPQNGTTSPPAAPPQGVIDGSGIKKTGQLNQVPIAAPEKEGSAVPSPPAPVPVLPHESAAIAPANSPPEKAASGGIRGSSISGVFTDSSAPTIYIGQSSEHGKYKDIHNYAGGSALQNMGTSKDDQFENVTTETRVPVASQAEWKQLISNLRENAGQKEKIEAFWVPWYQRAKVNAEKATQPEKDAFLLYLGALERNLRSAENDKDATLRLADYLDHEPLPKQSE
jgi:hypothetical protein